MSLNEMPSGERPHIVFFGVRNAGKSSLVNAVTGQALAVVSPVAGTTTDPVRKAMELAPAGPVLVVDTPGIDDEGDVGQLRVQRALRALDEADVAVLVADAARGLTPFDAQLLQAFRERAVPHVLAWNKTDVAEAPDGTGRVDSVAPSDGASLAEGARADGDVCHACGEVVLGPDAAAAARPAEAARLAPASASGERLACDGPSAPAVGARSAAGRGLLAAPCQEVRVSALTGEGVHQLKELLAAMVARAGEGGLGADGPSVGAKVAPRPLVADLLTPGDVVVLVIPLDSAAPKGRLILPQQQVMRDVLEAGAFPCAAGVEGLPALLDMLPRPPRLVVTDSQAFGAVAAAVPADVLLTSFSILMARYKGDLPAQLTAVRALETLSGSDTVLIAEGCTHHRQCNDIGTVKLPEWIRQISGASPQFAFTSGREFPDDLSPYAAVVHCGGCMLNRQEMQSRLRRATAQGVPATNYGMVIARANGILPRALAPLGIAAP